MRGTLRALLGAVGVVGAVIVWVVLLSGPAARAQSQAATQRVIVVLKNQEASLPATRPLVASRRTAIARDQAAVRSKLTASGARNVHTYTLIDALSAIMSPGTESQLKSDPNVSEVIPDQIIHLGSDQATDSGTGAGTSAPASSVCARSGKVQLNPQALETIHADSDVPGAQTARSLGFTGAGVTVGFIADGLNINNPDFFRPNGKRVIIDYKNFSGDGTNVPTGGEEAFGDASSIAAQGNQVYNVAGFGPHAVKQTCNIRIEGVAPGASLVALSIFGRADAGLNSSFLQAIDYAVTVDHVNVLNESLGSNYYPDDEASLDLIKAANDAAVAAGTTVTVSSGDAGVRSTIGTPSTDPEVIGAGATTTYRIDLQDGYGGAQFPGIKGYLNNNISSLSSGGFEQDGRTVDIVAPGELNWALCSKNTRMYSDCTDYNGQGTSFLPFGGTSESSPLTAGVAALVIQAYEKTHGGTTPSPQVVKQIIVSTSDDIGSPAEQQGAGLIDAYKTVLAAESYGPATSTGDTLLKSAGQLNAVGQPGTPESLTDTITNKGSSKQTISLSTRTIGAGTTVKTATVTLSDATSPKTTDGLGVPCNYQTVTFQVPAGQDRLDVSLAFQNALTDADPTYLDARVRLTLVDPAGDLAAYSIPQGDGNYGNVQVTSPQPGTWTAYVWSREAALGGTNGPVLFGAQVATYASFGQVSPTKLTLNPGQSAPVTLNVSTPATPGDAAGAIVLSSDSGPSFGRQSTIPVTLRSLIPTGPQTFNQTLTGGNGRELVTGVTFYYQLNVPAGVPELNASVALANNPNNPFTAFLISPSGEALAQASNELPSSTAPGYTNQLGAQLHVLAPAQGTLDADRRLRPAGVRDGAVRAVHGQYERCGSARLSGWPAKRQRRAIAPRSRADVRRQDHEHRTGAGSVLHRRPPTEQHVAEPGRADQSRHHGASDGERQRTRVPRPARHDRVHRDRPNNRVDADPVRLAWTGGRSRRRLDGRQHGQRIVCGRSDCARNLERRAGRCRSVWSCWRSERAGHDDDDRDFGRVRPDGHRADGRSMAGSDQPRAVDQPLAGDRRAWSDRHDSGHDHAGRGARCPLERHAVHR